MFNSRRIENLEAETQSLSRLVDRLFYELDELFEEILAVKKAVSPAKAPKKRGRPAKKVEKPVYKEGDWVEIVSFGDASPSFAKYIGTVHKVLEVYRDYVKLGINDGTVWTFEEVKQAKEPTKRKYVKSGKYAKVTTKKK